MLLANNSSTEHIYPDKIKTNVDGNTAMATF